MFPFENLAHYMTEKDRRPHIVFFGTDEFSVAVLDALDARNITPTLIVTTPDMPRGRNLQPSPTSVKLWAQEHEIITCQTEHILDERFIHQLDHTIQNGYQTGIENIKHAIWDIFLVASFGKILPKSILKIPHRGTINIHPSLLPKLRGASPIQTALLEEDETGVSIMDVDEKMDHGPLYAHEKLAAPSILMPYEALEKKLAILGANLFATILPRILSGDMEPLPQNHSQATYTKKILKEEGLLDFSDNDEINYRKYCAYHRWPRSFFTMTHNEHEMRVIISDALFENDTFIITKVIPEGRREITWEEFVHGYGDPRKK